MTPHASGHGRLAAFAASVALLTSAFAFVAASESAAAATWALVSTPNRMLMATANTLHAVSCTAANWCMAVGWYNDDALSADRALFETWNGTTWWMRRGTVHYIDRRAVSCLSPTWSTAVGYS